MIVYAIVGGVLILVSFIAVVILWIATGQSLTPAANGKSAGPCSRCGQHSDECTYDEFPGKVPQLYCPKCAGEIWGKT